MILPRGGSSLPVDQGIPHVGGDGARLSLVEPEDALDDGELSAGGVQPAEGAPVIHHHPRCDHLAAAVHCPCLPGHSSHQQGLAQLLAQPRHSSTHSSSHSPGTAPHTQLLSQPRRSPSRAAPHAQPRHSSSHTAPHTLPFTQAQHRSLLGCWAHTTEKRNSATSKVLKVLHKMINEQPLLSGEKLVWHSVKENPISRKDNSIHTSNWAGTEVSYLIFLNTGFRQTTASLTFCICTMCTIPEEQHFRRQLKALSSLFRLRKERKLSGRLGSSLLLTSHSESLHRKIVFGSPWAGETLQLSWKGRGGANTPQTPYHEWDLQQRRQFILVIDWSFWVHDSSLVTKNTVTSNQHLVCYCLSEHLHLQHIC